MRLSKNHIDYVAFLVLRALKENPGVTVRDADGVVGAVRHRIVENLRAEAEIEEEAKRMLEPHKAEILRKGADYAKMLADGKKTLAKKRGIAL